MRTLCRFAFKLFGGVSLGAISLKATAGATTITASWTLQTSGSVSVPTLGVYGAGALAVLVAVVMYRAISDNPRLMGALIVAGLSAGTVVGAVWITPSVADTFLTISSGDECNDQQSYDETFSYYLKNNCAAPVTVTYDLQASSCSAGGVANLECLPALPGETPICVSDGGSVPVGEERKFLNCPAQPQ